jgi:hypothetical protein
MAEPEPYRVERPRASGMPRSQQEEAERPVSRSQSLRPRAVFVAHGMGQQVRFQTLDDVARGLCKRLESHDVKVESRTATVVRVGCETVRRLELDLKKNNQPLPPVHLYEAYWAPLTEGAAGLWQVVRFLLRGGFNGLRSDARLNRFMFGKARQFHIKRWILALLGVVIATVIAMLVIGMTIAGVAIARFTFEGKGWITEELVSALTVLFELLLGTVAGTAGVAVMLIALARVLMPRDVPADVPFRKQSWRYRVAWTINALTIIPGAAIIAALWISAFIAIPVIFMLNERPPFGGRVCVWCSGFGADVFTGWGRWLAAMFAGACRFVDWLLGCSLPERLAWWVLIGIGIVIVVYALQALLSRDPEPESRGRGGRVAGLGLALLVLAGILAICGHGHALALITWLLLFGAVMFVRAFLIQFIGDVAIYVSPHLVDRFFDLRERIKTVVWRSARAVYACLDEDGNRLYQDVIVVGHSLGSVIVYDVLNRLINEDDLAAGTTVPCCDEVPVENLDVSNRTRLLLTFGSPLDKTAFIFACHDPQGGTERDALAAAVQPLITRERDFAWVNIWTPFDILGGPLQFYDTPDRKDEPQPNEKRVINRVDPQAITPLAAHTEFWKNPLIYEEIYKALS